jgi:hypothetical protein
LDRLAAPLAAEAVVTCGAVVDVGVAAAALGASGPRALFVAVTELDGGEFLRRSDPGRP